MGAFRVDEWLPTTGDAFPRQPAMADRWGLAGQPVAPNVEAYYVGRLVPEQDRARYPVRYCGGD